MGKILFALSLFALCLDNFASEFLHGDAYVEVEHFFADLYTNRFDSKAANYASSLVVLSSGRDVAQRFGQPLLDEETTKNAIIYSLLTVCAYDELTDQEKSEASNIIYERIKNDFAVYLVPRTNLEGLLSISLRDTFAVGAPDKVLVLIDDDAMNGDEERGLVYAINSDVDD